MCYVCYNYNDLVKQINKLRLSARSLAVFNTLWTVIIYSNNVTYNKTCRKLTSVHVTNVFHQLQCFFAESCFFLNKQGNFADVCLFVNK